MSTVFSGSSSLPPFDDERDADRLLPWKRSVAVAVGAQHVAVVGEVDHVRIVGQAGLLQALQDAAHVGIQILHHRRAAGAVAPGPLHDVRQVGHVRPEVHGVHRVAPHIFRRCDVFGVRRHDAEHGQERPLRRTRLQVIDEQIGQCVGLVSGELTQRGLGTVLPVPMHVAVEVGAVVLVPDPGAEAAPPLLRHAVQVRALRHVIGLPKTIQMPLAEVRGVVARCAHDPGDRGQRRIQPLGGLNAALVAVEPGVQGSSERRAPRAVRHRPGKGDAIGGQPVQVRRDGIRVAHVPLGLTAVQVSVDPDDVGSAPVHRSIRIAGNDPSYRAEDCRPACRDR